MKTNVCAMLAGAAFPLLAACQPNDDSANNAADPEPIPVEEAGAKDLTVSGPYSHRNLDVYLVHGEDRMKDISFLTLDEAMKSGAVVVHETGDVNELKIENKSKDAHVFIHSGDILKGGKQDRTLPNSLVLAPGAKPTPVDSFCVEQSRWARRGGESIAYFEMSTKQVNTKGLKIASRLKRDQGEVWKEVAVSQEKLSRNVGQEVNSPVSQTSLQLALENKDLEAETKLYTAAIDEAVKRKDDVIGYAFAVNGEFNSGDIYLTRDLFKKLWPRRLEAAAGEALAEADGAGEFERIEAGAILTALRQADDARSTSETLAGRNVVQVRESEKAYRFDACYAKDDKTVVVHENVIAK